MNYIILIINMFFNKKLNVKKINNYKKTKQINRFQLNKFRITYINIKKYKT